MIARAVAFTRIQSVLRRLIDTDEALAGMHGLPASTQAALHQHLVAAGNSCVHALQIVTDNTTDPEQEDRTDAHNATASQADRH